jgi:hypothetical protein
MLYLRDRLAKTGYFCNFARTLNADENSESAIGDRHRDLSNQAAHCGGAKMRSHYPHD